MRDEDRTAARLPYPQEGPEGSRNEIGMSLEFLTPQRAPQFGAAGRTEKNERTRTRAAFQLHFFLGERGASRQLAENRKDGS